MRKTKNMRLREMENGRVSFEWDTLKELLEDIEEAKQKSCAQFTAGSYIDDPESWYGCGSEAEYMHHLQNGWPELRQQLEKMMEDAIPLLPQFHNKTIERHRKRKRADHGDELDMGRVWNGELDTAWVAPHHTERESITTKRITVAIDISTSCQRSNNQCMWRAALATVLCDKLAAAGKSFEVYATSRQSRVWYNDVRTLHTAFCIKRTSEPLVLDTLCTMVSVGMQRACNFRSFHTALDGQVKSHYATYDVHDGLPATLQERRDKGELILHIDACFSRTEMLREYEKAWHAVEEHVVRETSHAA